MRNFFFYNLMRYFVRKMQIFGINFLILHHCESTFGNINVSWKYRGNFTVILTLGVTTNDLTVLTRLLGNKIGLFNHQSELNSGVRFSWLLIFRFYSFIVRRRFLLPLKTFVVTLSLPCKPSLKSLRRINQVDCNDSR